MSQRSGQWIELDEQFDDLSNEAGFLTLGLAQLVMTFAFWMGLWPGAFGIYGAPTLASVLAGLFALSGGLGFYLSFRAFTLEPELPE